MSEWASVLAVFWLLWLLDGARWLPRRAVSVAISLPQSAGTRVAFSRASWVSPSPFGFRVVTPDIPLSLSPFGVCNLPAGSVGRPAEMPPRVQCWRWEDIREIGQAGGWLFINGVRFCPDTGHVSGPQLLALAGRAGAERELVIRRLLNGWFRPLALRRRAQIMRRRTRVPATLNLISALGWLGLSVFVFANLAARLPVAWQDRTGEAAALLFGGLIVLHFVAMTTAWRAARGLRTTAATFASGPGLPPDHHTRRAETGGADFVNAGAKRSSALLSALLLPAQALRLRSLVADGIFSPQHPLAVIAAFGPRRQVEVAGFAALADARWPLPGLHEDAAAQQVLAWYRAAVEERLQSVLTFRGVDAGRLLTAPIPDSPASVRFCPRCHAQFVGREVVCPNGLPLRELPGRERLPETQSRSGASRRPTAPRS